MRFYSDWVHSIWLYKIVDFYYPFSSKTWNTVTLVLYGIVGGADYALRMFPVWHTRLHAVNENLSVADRFSLYEFAVSCIASMVSAYWFFETHVPPLVWAIALALAWIGDFLLQKSWKLHLGKLQASTYKHVPI
jgi:hypothetical protein